MTDYTLRKFMSANGYGIISVTGRAHCQHQVAFFNKMLAHCVFAELLHVFHRSKSIRDVTFWVASKNILSVACQASLRCDFHAETAKISVSVQIHESQCFSDPHTLHLAFYFSGLHEGTTPVSAGIPVNPECNAPMGNNAMNCFDMNVE